MSCNLWAGGVTRGSLALTAPRPPASLPLLQTGAWPLPLGADPPPVATTMAPAGALLALALVVLSGAGGARAGDCKGQRQVLGGSSGYVSDGPGNYSVNGNCEWLIEGGGAAPHRAAPSLGFRVNAGRRAGHH